MHDALAVMFLDSEIPVALPIQTLMAKSVFERLRASATRAAQSLARRAADVAPGDLASASKIVVRYHASNLSNKLNGS